MTIVVIGAGIGGLTAAIALAARGEAVTVLEAQSGAGGKLLPVIINGHAIDSGPTVLTMRWVFDQIFELCGKRLDDHLNLLPLEILARHYWSGGVGFDLCSDHDRTVDAIGRFAGSSEAAGYVHFAEDAKRIHQSLLKPFLQSQRPTPWGLAAAMPLRDVMAINPFENLWKALSKYFSDPRLQQLFGRYATYCGASPFFAPATLMLVADVEASGVWRVQGGMAQVAKALQELAESLGVQFHFNCRAERIGKGEIVDQHGVRHVCKSIVVNADAAAVPALLGGNVERFERSLSAVTWCGEVESDGFPLEHHTVFFSDDYKQEFSELKSRAAADPTVYICDQEQGHKLVLVNAPADGSAATQHVETAMLQRLEKSGLKLKLKNIVRRGPQDFAKLYPATQGALYGRATHGWMATFQRPQARTKIPNLYLAGGSTHPGPGVPMAALSGLRAAEALLADRGMM